jgi:hypothetical protein
MQYRKTNATCAKCSNLRLRVHAIGIPVRVSAAVPYLSSLSLVEVIASTFLVNEVEQRLCGTAPQVSGLVSRRNTTALTTSLQSACQPSCMCRAPLLPRS